MLKKTVQPAGGPSLAYSVFRPSILPRFYFAPDGDGGGTGGAGSGEQTGAQQQTQGQAGKEVEFTPEQQAKVQELINHAHGKAWGKAEQKFTTEINDLKTQLEKLAKGGGKPDEKKDGAKTYDEATIKQLLDGVRAEYEPKITEANQTIEKLRNHQRTAAIVSAAAKLKAVDPDVVATLVGPMVSVDDEGRLVVLDAKGQPRLNQKAEPLEVDEFVGQFLEERPYLKQAANGGGAGSGGNKGGGAGQTFTRKQISDPAFYQANRDAIHAAARDGRIVD